MFAKILLIVDGVIKLRNVFQDLIKDLNVMGIVLKIGFLIILNFAQIK